MVDGGKPRRTGTWKATRTSFTREDEAAPQHGLLRASSGSAASSSERPAWNPLLVRDPDRCATLAAGVRAGEGVCEWCVARGAGFDHVRRICALAQASQRPDDGGGDRGHVPAPP